MRTPFSLALVVYLCAFCLGFPGAGRAMAVTERPAEGRLVPPAVKAPLKPALATALALQTVEPDAYEPDDSPADAKELMVDGERQEHTFHQPTDNDWVYFSLSAGDRVELFTTGRACDTYLYLYAPDAQTVIAEDDDSGGPPNAAIRFTAPEDGDYYARVRIFGTAPNACGPYQLALASLPPLLPDDYEPDDSPDQATPLVLDGTPQERNIHIGGDRDWISFDITQAPIAVIVVTGGECDLFMTLFGRDGATVLATDDDSGSLRNPAIFYTINEAGTYFAEIRHFDAANGSCDDYLLGGITQEPALPDAYEPDNNPTQAKPLPLDGTLQQHSFHAADDDDWVSFPASAGDRIFLATEGACDTYISVFAPDRRTLLREDDDSGGQLNAALLFVAQETGTHYARVRLFGGGARACASYQLYGALVRRGEAPPGTPVTPGTTPPPGVTPGVPVQPTPTATPATRPAAPTPTSTFPIIPPPPGTVR